VGCLVQIERELAVRQRRPPIKGTAKKQHHRACSARLGQ
jgi:hypothetical protein